MSLPERSGFKNLIHQQVRLNLKHGKDSRALQDAGGDWKQLYTDKLRHTLAAINPRLFGRFSHQGEDEI